MRVGIIGTGRMGRRRALDTLGLAGATLKWVCSRTRQRSETFLKEISGEPAGRSARETTGADASRRPSRHSALRNVAPLASWEQAVARDDVDGIIIAAPNALHAAMASAALEQGKAVLLEYPHATRPADGRRLIQLALERGVRLHIGLSHRYGAAHKSVLRLLHAGHKTRPLSVAEGAGTRQDTPRNDPDARIEELRVGAPRTFQLLTCSGNPISRWYDDDSLSGGMFIASLYHFIDEARSFFGTVSDVAAHYSSRREAGGKIAQDCGNVMLAFEQGCVAQLTYARGYPKPGLESRRTILCENGYIDLAGGKIRVLSPKGEESFKPEGPDAIFEDTRTFLQSVPTQADPLAEQAQLSLEVAARAQALAAGR